MAVDVCTEISSPRISFSYNLRDFDFVPVENYDRRSDSLLLNPSVDFDFCRGLLHHEISPADELFSDGKILPVQIKKLGSVTLEPIPKQIKSQNTTRNVAAEKRRLVEFLSSALDEGEDGGGIEKPVAKPFWQFRRSSSADSESGRGTGLLRIRSLQFLTRSNSTGSVPCRNPTGFERDIQKQKPLTKGPADRRSYPPENFPHRRPYYYYPCSNSCSVNSYNDGNTASWRKGSLRKSGSTSSGNNNGVRIIPVLNIPPPTYIGKSTVSLFGIGSFFCSKKSKKKS